MTGLVAVVEAVTVKTAVSWERTVVGAAESVTESPKGVGLGVTLGVDVGVAVGVGVAVALGDGVGVGVPLGAP